MVAPLRQVARQQALQDEEDWNRRLQEVNGRDRGRVPGAQSKGFHQAPNRSFESAQQARGGGGGGAGGPGGGGGGAGGGGGTGANAPLPGTQRNTGNRWYGDIPDISLGEFAANPALVAEHWSGQRGFGNMTSAALQDFSDPSALMQGLGMKVGPGNTDVLDATGDIFNQAMGLGKGPNQYFDPRAIVSNVVNLNPNRGVSGDKGFDQLTVALTDANPGEQVKRTVNFLGAALRGLIPEETYGAYMAMLGQEGKNFMLNAAQNPQQSKYFFQHLRERLGPSGGF